jgi:hypothetical protein
MKMKKLIDNLPEIFGGSGSIIGLITVGKIIEVLLFAALGALVGLMVKEIWNYCKKKICKS